MRLARRLGLKKTPIEGFDFELGFPSATIGANALIRILRGPYAGTVYSYDTVRVTEEPGLGVAKLSFHYTIVRNSEFQGDPTFEHLIGEILRVMLTQQESRIGRRTESK